LTFSTKAKLPTATASDHRASRADNSSRRRGGREKGDAKLFLRLSLFKPGRSRRGLF
jgi:hypothetical protein